MTDQEGLKTDTIKWHLRSPLALRFRSHPILLAMSKGSCVLAITLWIRHDLIEAL